MPMLPTHRPRFGRSLLVIGSAAVLMAAIMFAVVSRDEQAGAVQAGASPAISGTRSGFHRSGSNAFRHRYRQYRATTTTTAAGTSLTSATGPTTTIPIPTLAPPTTPGSVGGDTTTTAVPSPPSTASAAGTSGSTTTTRLTATTAIPSPPSTASTSGTSGSTTSRLTTTTPPPTVAPTTTAAPSGSASLNCAAVPSRCGYPDATNTGPAPGTSFVNVPSQARSGAGWEWSDALDGIRVFGTGTTLNGVNVSGMIVIDAPNVTVSNSIVSACGGDSDGDVIAIRVRPSDPSYRGTGARVIHNRINGTPAGCTHRARSGVRDIYGEATGLYVDGNDISGTGNGITAEYEATIVNNWVHDLGHLAGDHHSGISTHGGAKQIVIQHNTALLHGQKFAGGGGVSGAITVYSDFGHAQNTTVQDNMISGGSYVVYGGNSGDGYTTPATNIKFISNRFRCGDWLYGPVAAFSASSTGNQWSGNYCDQTAQAVTAN